MNRRVQQLLNLVKLTDRTMDDVSYEKLTEEIAVKNKGKNNTMERIRNYIFCIFEKSHPLCRTNCDLAVTFQKSD